MSNKERQAAYRARQREAGRRSMTVQVTAEEQFHLERVLIAMRRQGSVPAFMRRSNGRCVDVEECK